MVSGKVSTSKGKSGSRKPRQKHQNTFAYAPSKYSTQAQIIAGLPVQGLCKRCMDIILWRKRMGQYKPLTVPKKCVSCSQKAIKDAYHILCGKCAAEKNVCAKCQEPEEIMPSTSGKTQSELAAEKQAEERLLSRMSERQRRSYLRKLERGDEEGAERIKGKIVERGAGSDSDYDDDDFDFSDLEDELDAVEAEGAGAGAGDEDDEDDFDDEEEDEEEEDD
ncbi:hypothetical protein HDV05_006461 [Chytridiales sp. JEL 0842]|nr:hypothetical protein HDV05_006461 [Chytridiales sp. JEL 0842]